MASRVSREDVIDTRRRVTAGQNIAADAEQRREDDRDARATAAKKGAELQLIEARRQQLLADQLANEGAPIWAWVVLAAYVVVCVTVFLRATRRVTHETYETRGQPGAVPAGLL